MSQIEFSEAEKPSPLAVHCGRIMFIFVGLIMLGVGAYFLYENEQAFLSLAVLSGGVLKIWCGLSMSDKTVAHFGFWSTYFLD